MNKLKIAGYLLAVLALIGVGYKLAPVHPAETKTVYVDRVVVKDRVVTKDVVRTETRPDGTKIVTQTAEHSETKTNTHEVKKETVVVSSDRTHYSLGLGLVLDPFHPLNRVYNIEIGKRLWQSPVWVTMSYQTNRTVLFGLRTEF